MKKTSFLGVLEGLVGLHRTYSLFSITGWGTDLDYCDTERFALETNRDHSVIFEIVLGVYSIVLGVYSKVIQLYIFI